MPESSRREILTRYWRQRVVGTVDHVAVNGRVHEDGGWNAHYLVMVVLSAGIAALGLLLSSPAVVIGAMLISPLMGPIIGLGFALATLDAHQMRRSATALAAGSLLAVLFCALVVLASPLQNVTAEIAARTRPNLFDLVVALLSAVAGTYATIRGRSGTIVGVAIATALMPPLATVGFGLATLNGAVFGGALLLFVTNFVTIALTATVMARLYGFGPMLSPNQTVIQTLAIVATFAALAIPLGFSLRQLAWEGLASNTARTAVQDVFRKDARISQVDVDFAASPLKVTATVLTPHYRGDADRVVAAQLERAFDRRVSVAIEQFRVGNGDADAAAAAQPGAAAQTESLSARGDMLARSLVLIAGVDAERVLLDRDKRIAFVRAAPLAGATLATYRTLETRLAVMSDGWTVLLVPPPVAPGELTLTDGVPDAEAIARIAWATARRQEPVAVSGPRDDAEAVVTALRAAGAAAEVGTIHRGAVSVAWSAPGA